MGCYSSTAAQDPERESKRRKKIKNGADDTNLADSQDGRFFKGNTDTLPLSPSHDGVLSTSASSTAAPSPPLVEPIAPPEKTFLSNAALASPKPPGSQCFEHGSDPVNKALKASVPPKDQLPVTPRLRKDRDRQLTDGTALTAAPRDSAHDLSVTNQRASVGTDVKPTRREAKGSAHKRVSESAPPQRKPKARAKARISKVGKGNEMGSHGAESWPVFLERAAHSLGEAGIAKEAVPLFEQFRTSDDLKVIFACFAHLSNLAINGSPWACAGDSDTSTPPWRFPFEAMRVLLGGHWKAKQLWEKLDRRCSRPEYADMPCASNRLQSLNAVVVGGGPCGLRAAIELRLLGARVIVVEKRAVFSRINQLHLWSWCGEEVKALGARCLEPPGQDFGANPDKLHVGISELQVLLLKTALLVGVEVFLGTEFLGYEWAGGWCVRLGNAVADAPSPRPPERVVSVGVLLGADGLGSDSVGKAVGVEAIEAGSLRSEDAIGLVVNFAPLEGNAAAERSLRSFALAKQFFVPLFQELTQQTGAELENIVYTKSKLSHYFVMTPTRRCLINSSVVRDESHKPILAGENIDAEALDAFARKVVGFRFKQSERSLIEAAQEAGIAHLQYADRGPQLFDFSKLRRAAEGLLFCDPPQRGCVADGDDEDALLVALVGDALLEPFWPEGLGIVRGFFSALDASSAITKWANGESREATQQHFAAAFTQLKSLSGATRASVLRPDESKYNLAPSSRYRAIVSG